MVEWPLCAEMVVIHKRTRPAHSNTLFIIHIVLISHTSALTDRQQAF